MAHLHEFVPKGMEPWGVSNKFRVYGECSFCGVEGEIIIRQEDIEWEHKVWYEAWFEDGELKRQDFSERGVNPYKLPGDDDG